MKVIASSIRKGNIIERDDGQLYVVLTAESFHPGKGTPTTQIDMRRLSDGVKTTDRYKTTEQVERAYVEDRALHLPVPGRRRLHLHEHRELRSGDRAERGDRRPGRLSAGKHGGHAVAVQRHRRRHPAAAAGDAGGGRDRAGDEGPDRVLLLQAGEAVERRAHDGAARISSRARASW